MIHNLIAVCLTINNGFYWFCLFVGSLFREGAG